MTSSARGPLISESMSVVVIGIILFVFLNLPVSAQNNTGDRCQDDRKNHGFTVNEGSVEDAKAYYRRISGSSHTGFDFLADASFDQLLDYLGYIEETGGARLNLVARDIETATPLSTLDPDKLDEFVGTGISDQLIMRFQRHEDPKRRVLISRFFAPKIVNYAVSSRPVPGWRKLVYLPAQPGSKAHQNFIASAYILFNYFQPDPDKDPFGDGTRPGHAVSQNNQVILIPDFSASFDRNDTRSNKRTFRRNLVDTAYFAVYAGYRANDHENSYLRLETLTAGFDIPQDCDPIQYAIPDACAHCHGDKNRGEGVVIDGERRYVNVKPNYLDTDQWYDALRMDFPEVAASPFDPVFDGGKNHGSDRYRRAMAVIGRLNFNMMAEGFWGETEGNLLGNSGLRPSYQVKGVLQWQELHGFSNVTMPLPQAPIARAFDDNAERKWDKTDPDHALLLEHMSKYCFRCHSSINFNVFDFDYIAAKKSLIKSYIGGARIMPLGRDMSQDVDCIKSLLDSLEDPRPATGCGPAFGQKPSRVSIALQGLAPMDRASLFAIVRSDSSWVRALSDPGTFTYYSADDLEDIGQCSESVAALQAARARGFTRVRVDTLFRPYFRNDGFKNIRSIGQDMIRDHINKEFAIGGGCEAILFASGTLANMERDRNDLHTVFQNLVTAGVPESSMTVVALPPY